MPLLTVYNLVGCLASFCLRGLFAHLLQRVNVNVLDEMHMHMGGVMGISTVPLKDIKQGDESTTKNISMTN